MKIKTTKNGEAQSGHHLLSHLSSVVICDDHPISQMGVEYTLKEIYPQAAITYTKVGTGKEALHMVKTTLPDLLVLDLHLPDINGIEVLKNIRSYQAKTKVIILTSEENLVVLLQLLHHSVDAILLKSYSISIFKEALQHVLSDNSEGPYISLQFENRIKGIKSSEPLTSREFQVLDLLLKGYSNRAISSILECSPETVKTHRSQIMSKINAHDRTDILDWSRKGNEN